MSITATEKRRMAAQEKIWQEESDVRVLSSAEEIKRDRSRLGAAKKRAVQMAKDTKAQLSTLNNVAKGKVGTTVKANPGKRATKKPNKRRGGAKKR